MFAGAVSGKSVSFYRLTVIVVGSDSCRIECLVPDRTTDALLLERAEAGDPAAFINLYERHRTAIFRFSYRLSGSVEVAEDITHDCFLGLIRKPGNFRPGRALLRTYLLAAARNLWLKGLRDYGRETPMDEDADDNIVAPGKEPLSDLLDDELSFKVAEAIAGLPPLQREALILFEYEGLALNEIAAMVGTDVGAIKSRLHRARARLRDVLRPYLTSQRELNPGREIVTLGAGLK
jgi:RNA polymerase sigma-70 factor, ECF subfamily